MSAILQNADSACKICGAKIIKKSLVRKKNFLIFREEHFRLGRIETASPHSITNKKAHSFVERALSIECYNDYLFTNRLVTIPSAALMRTK